jgi:hypothetical protein
MGMREAREREAEVVQPMHQHDAGDRDAELTRVGEVGQAETPGRVLLSEHDILLRTGQRPPRPDAPFQRAPHARADLGVAPPHLGQNRDGTQAGRRLQDRHDLGVPDLGQRIGPPSSARRLLLRR